MREKRLADGCCGGVRFPAMLRGRRAGGEVIGKPGDAR